MDAETWQSQSIIDEIRSINPDALINNRLFLPGDFDALERHLNIPENQPWESDESLNLNWSWVPHTTPPTTASYANGAVCSGASYVEEIYYSTSPPPQTAIYKRMSSAVCIPLAAICAQSAAMI